MQTETELYPKQHLRVSELQAKGFGARNPPSYSVSDMTGAAGRAASGGEKFWTKQK